MNASLSFVIICGVDQDANAWVNKNQQKIISKVKMRIKEVDFWKREEKVLIDYGGIFSVPTSILINKKGEEIFSYPGAILKSYDRYDGVYSAINNKIQSALED